MAAHAEGIISGDKREGEEDVPRISTLYDFSVAQILKVADKVERGKMLESEQVNYFPDAKVPDVPHDRTWDFKLGDEVKVKLSREDFKYVQQKTTTWTVAMNRIYGDVGLITSWNCDFINATTVHFPNTGITVLLHVGTLEKVKQPEFQSLNSKFKVGDYVKSISAKNVLRHLQYGFDTVPEYAVGKRGRVIGFTHYHVLVTVDGQTTLGFRSESLIPLADNTSPLNVNLNQHPRGFKAGEKVRVISNMKKLIENQAEVQGWDPVMSHLRGETVTVIGVSKTGAILVQSKYSKQWDINHNSLLRSGESEQDSDDLRFLPGDVVKVVLGKEDRNVFALCNVPFSFLEFQRITGVVIRVDKNFNYEVSFFPDLHVNVQGLYLRKATEEEKKIHEGIQKKVENLKVGDKVCLEVGPPNYIRTVAEHLEVDSSIADALTKPAEIVNFIDAYTVVVEYENKKKFKISKNYLTVPEKFQIGQVKKPPSAALLFQLHTAIYGIVLHVDKDGSVEIVFVSDGNPPCVEFRVESTVATFENIFQCMKIVPTLEITNLGCGQMLVSRTNMPATEIKFALTFNDEPRAFPLQNAEIGSLNEGGPASSSATSIVGGSTSGERPKVQDLKDFSYIKLYNPSLGRDVFFPYVLHGPHRQPTDSVNRDDATQFNQPTTSINIGNVESLNVGNSS